VENSALPHTIEHKPLTPVSSADALHVRQRVSKDAWDASLSGNTGRESIDPISPPRRRSRVNERDAHDACDELEEIFGSFVPVLTALAASALALAAVLVVELGGSVGQLLHR